MESIFFRLVDENNKNLTEIRRFNLFSLDAVTPISVVASTFKDKAAATIKWSVPSELLSVYSSGKHTLEIFSDKAQAKIVFTAPLEISSGSLKLTPLELGNYFLKIKSDVRGFKYEGDLANLSIEKVKNLKLNTLNPTYNSFYSAGQDVSFEWTLQPFLLDDVNYKLEIKNKERMLLSQDLNDSKFFWDKVPEDAYDYRLVAYVDSNVVAESEWISFNVGRSIGLGLLSPKNTTTLKVWPNSPIDFSWKKIIEDPVREYRLEISQDSSFSQYKKQEISKKSSLVTTLANLEEGTYFWRVVAVLENGEEQVSSVYNFSYKLPDLLAKVLLKDLRKEYVLRDNKNPYIKWKAIEAAAAYEVEIVGADGRSPASYASQNLKSTSLLLPKLNEGKYKIRLWPIDPAGRRGEILESKFSVSYGELLRAPKLRKPVVE